MSIVIKDCFDFSYDGTKFPFPSCDFPDGYTPTVAEVAGKLAVTTEHVQKLANKKELLATENGTIMLYTYRQFVRRRMIGYYWPFFYPAAQFSRDLRELAQLLDYAIEGDIDRIIRSVGDYFFISLDFPNRGLLTLPEVSEKLPGLTDRVIEGSIERGGGNCAIDVGLSEGIDLEYRVPREVYRARVFLSLTDTWCMSNEQRRTCLLEMAVYTGVTLRKIIHE